MRVSVVYAQNMSKDFDKWNENKKAIENRPFQENVHERDIWWASIGINVGSEQDGKNEYYERPVLILRRFSRKVVLTIPLTSKPKSDPYHFHFISNNKPCSVILSQLKLLSTKRLRRFIGKISKEDFELLMVTLVSNIFHKNDSRPL